MDELGSRSVQLRPLLPEDSSWCYAMMCGPAGASWRYRGRTPSPEVFQSDLWRGVYAQYLVVERASGRRCGLVGLYNASLEASRAHAFAVAEPSLSAPVSEGFGLLLDWAFREVGLSRVFLEVPEFNAQNFASLGDAAVVEGRLRNYEIWKGRFWDLLFVSISAESFSQRVGPLLERRRGGSGSGVSVSEFADFVRDSWPLDSLALVEALDMLEECCGRPLDSVDLAAVDAEGPAVFVDGLLRQVRAERAAGPVGVAGLADRERDLEMPAALR